MATEKESYLQPGVTVAKAVTVFIGSVLVILSQTLSSAGISQIQGAILSRWEHGMEYFAMLVVLASMGLVIMMPIGGKLSDLFGRKVLMWIGSSIFLVGSIITALAPTLASFLIARALFPFGQAITMVVPYAVLAGVFQGKGRNMAYGALSAVLGFGYFLGGTIAGFLADVNLAWISIAYPGVTLFIGCILINSQITNVKREGKIYIDFPGMFFLAVIVVALMYTTTYGAQAGWTSPIILTAMVVFVIALIAFVIIEKKSPEPLLPLFMFKNPIIIGILLISLFSVFYQKPMAAYVPLMLQRVMGVSQGVSGTVLVARAITNIAFPTIIAAWAVKNLDTRIWKTLLLCGLAISIAFFMVWNTSQTTSLAIYFAAFAFLGLSESCKAAVITPFIQSVVEQKDMGAATSLNSFFGAAGSNLAGCFAGLTYNALVPDPRNISELQSGINKLFIITAITGICIILLAIFFVRPAQKKAAERKAQATSQVATA
jgi:MFS family permease